jgi:hypothetical protein
MSHTPGPWKVEAAAAGGICEVNADDGRAGKWSAICDVRANCLGSRPVNDDEAFAKAYHARYDDPVAKSETNQLDHVIGPYWANVGLAIKRLLDGDTGGLDCGSIARNITAAIEAEGFETDGYKLTGEGE